MRRLIATCVLLTAAACYSTNIDVGDTLWAKLDAAGEPDRWFADPAGRKRCEALWVGYDAEDDVVFFATRWSTSIGVPERVWKDRDVVAHAGSRDESGLRVFAKQGGLDANERVRRAARRLQEGWDRWRSGRSQTGYEPLYVTVRLVANGRELEGAVVATVQPSSRSRGGGPSGGSAPQPRYGEKRGTWTLDLGTVCVDR